MKMLVIHAGMAKTGSSSIQESLWEARRQLAGQGIYYPGWEPSNHSFELSALFRTEQKSGFLYRQLSPITDEDWAAHLETLLERWQAFFQQADAGTFIMSAESLEHFHAEELQALVDFAGDGFDRVSVVVYVRHPCSSISSRFEQAVKQLREPADPNQLLIAAKKQARFDTLRRWRKVRGITDIIVRPFDRAQFPQGNLLDDFFTALGLPTGARPLPDEAANTSLGRNAVAFLLLHNANFPLYTDAGPNPQRGLSRRQDLLFRLMRSVKDDPLALDIRFDADEARQINAEIAFVNEFLASGAAFAPVSSSEEPTQLPAAGDVSIAFLSALVNTLALELDRTMDDQRHLAATLRKERETALLREQTAKTDASVDEQGVDDGDATVAKPATPGDEKIDG